MRRTRRAAFGGFAVAAAPLVLAIGPPTAQAAPEVESELAPVMVVLDASGSMEEDDPSGGTKMDAARTALDALVDETPTEAQMGLTVYGATPEAYDDIELGCEDIVTSRPVDALDKNDFKAAVDAIEPGGYTPIGSSLRHAADELPDEGPRSVILISDGEDTCAPPPPCEVAQELADEGVDLAIHTVGFNVDDKTRADLECIADAAGGTYVDAPDAATLQKELPAVAERALRSYGLAGTPITGAEAMDDAPTIEPGQWVDTIDDGQQKYYALHVPEGFRAHVAATAVPPMDEAPPGPTDWLELRTKIVNEGGETCAAHDEPTLHWNPIYTAAIGWLADNDSPCLGQEDLYLVVERDGPSDSVYPTYDTELLVILEPPVSGSNTSDEDPEPEEPEEPSGDQQPVMGGGSLNDATELPGSGRFTDEVRYGEMATYKVWLDWGESMAVQVHSGEGNMEGFPHWPAVRAEVYSPTRSQDYDADWTSSETTQNDPVSLNPIQLPPVSYGNRSHTDTYGVGSASMAGWYYITVDIERDPSTAEVPVQLNLAVGGQKTDPPAYEQVGDYPAEPVTEATTDGAEESPEPDDSDAEPSDDESASAPNTDDTTAAASSSDPGGLPWVLVGGAVLLLLGLALFVIQLSRTRRRSAHS